MLLRPLKPPRIAIRRLTEKTPAAQQRRVVMSPHLPLLRWPQSGPKVGANPSVSESVRRLVSTPQWTTLVPCSAPSDLEAADLHGASLGLGSKRILDQIQTRRTKPSHYATTAREPMRVDPKRPTISPTFLPR